MKLKVFNLDKSDNLLDTIGATVFDVIQLSQSDTGEEIVCSKDQVLGVIVFFPLNNQQASERTLRNEFILDLDSLSYAVHVNYTVEEIRCAGKKIRVESYNFEGQDFDFNANLEYNTIELFVDL